MSTTDTTTTPREVTDSATETSALDLSQTQLLGLFGGENASRALLRSPDGAMIMAEVNDATFAGNVVAISDTYVLLRQNRTVVRLTLPL